ncbi:MAG: hypothetical protein AAGF28_09855 [Pseudomonadota bacterium]
MKAGLTTSALVHVAVLAGAMVSLAAPKPLLAPEVEALPIELVPFEEISKAVQGAPDAKPDNPPAPKPTAAPPRPEPAENAGETEIDKQSDADKIAPQPPVEKTEAPTPQEAPAPVERPPQPEKTPEPPKPEPKTDIALLLKQSQPDQQSAEDTPDEPEVKLPERVVVPKKRPSPVKEKVVEAKPEEPKDNVTKKAVVNKEESTAAGAKRSTQKEALGTKKKSNASRLAQSEIDAVRGRLEGCWSVGDLTGHPDAATMRARVTVNLNRDGTIDGRVKVKVSGTDRSTRATLSVRVRSAIIECAPYNLPVDKYDTWSEMIVNFSLADMI